MSDSEDSDDEFKELFDVFDQVRVQRTVGIIFGAKKNFCPGKSPMISK